MEDERGVIYLDTSAIVKRYVYERGSEVVVGFYNKALSGVLKLAFSIWNIGEVLGVLDRYARRGALDLELWKTARRNFLGETRRLAVFNVLKLVEISPGLLKESWGLVEKHHIYQADALQIVSAKYIRAGEFITADKPLCGVAKNEGLNVVCIG